MSNDQPTPSPPSPGCLPERPSAEFLRKAAKRRARADQVALAEAQRRTAADHGFARWADLIRAAEAAAPRSPLYRATAAADADAVARLLQAGAAVEGDPGDPARPLWALAAAPAPEAAKIATARALLDAGAFLHTDQAGETPLHAAARTGPLGFVEFLIARGALEWMHDRRGHTPAQAARRGGAQDKDAIAELLQRPVIRDPVFRQAVEAIHAGQAETLARLLDAHPRLLTERISEPECYRQAERSQYFRDPMLVWFTADNPNLVVPMPPGMVDCVRVMTARGVAQADLDYTLGLAVTSAPAHAAGLLGPLMQALLDAGAKATDQVVLGALGHALTEPIRILLASGHPWTAPIAAALGDVDRLQRLLADASPDDLQTTLGLAVINRQPEAATLALAAGADVDGFLPIHVHSTALHQAANYDDVPMLELLVAHGARDDIPDKMFRGTALGWARHENKPAARAYLEQLAAARRPEG